ncbi:MAG: serine hydrolase [Parcubacteria group bacterium]|jgi:D-alanyl-D-alanine carboxypeptidase
MIEKLTKKQREIFATYPIAILVFFGFLVSVSVYVHQIYMQPVADHTEKVIVQSDPKIQQEKQQRVQEILAKQNDATARVIYQPIKNKNAQDLAVENAHAAIVLDAESGTILWQKNATEKRSLASITKLVTAMVVIDRMRDLNEVVTIPESVMGIEGTKVGCPTSVICNSPRLYPGEKVRIKDLLSAMLMYSANDAATVLGMHVAGSEEEFAILMNARMKELGAGNTHFCRPSGLELDVNEESCYSSAYDIARVMAHLLQHDKYDVLWEIMRTDETTFSSVDGSVTHELKNTDRLIGGMSNLVGAKTGFTPRAGYCLALAASDPSGKHHVVTVVLDDYHRFDDVEMMSAWAFANYTWQ